MPTRTLPAVGFHINPFARDVLSMYALGCSCRVFTISVLTKMECVLKPWEVMSISSRERTAYEYLFLFVSFRFVSFRSFLFYFLFLSMRHPFSTSLCNAVSSIYLLGPGK